MKAPMASILALAASAIDIPSLFTQNDSFLAQTSKQNDVAVCPGEGDRYGDYKCNHDQTHRVCAQLIDTQTSQPLSWGSRDFWEITGQKQVQWDDKIRGEPNPGDSWCICMWATAKLIEKVGCENVHLRCDATDVSYVLSKYDDNGRNLKAAHDCLQQKCQA
eukprot:CAMPEP_0170468822 /NCGR_PEP_ID=MMETSP0123-20130129/11859_1 /TAXON_ID=182087 /ORGANISM="Favella ehrenbergii, Strain Fehren 1" /LENGTH=161 /DNA_ID=CAMNT_0010735489 /DNA_START=6 /DNA_END=491 /DNA_ORIENTATION=+